MNSAKLATFFAELNLREHCSWSKRSNIASHHGSVTLLSQQFSPLLVRYYNDQVINDYPLPKQLATLYLI